MSSTDRKLGRQVVADAVSQHGDEKFIRLGWGGSLSANTSDYGPDSIRTILESGNIPASLTPLDRFLSIVTGTPMFAFKVEARPLLAESLQCRSLDLVGEGVLERVEVLLGVADGLMEHWNRIGQREYERVMRRKERRSR